MVWYSSANHAGPFGFEPARGALTPLSPRAKTGSQMDGAGPAGHGGFDQYTTWSGAQGGVFAAAALADPMYSDFTQDPDVRLPPTTDEAAQHFADGLRAQFGSSYMGYHPDPDDVGPEPAAEADTSVDPTLVMQTSFPNWADDIFRWRESNERLMSERKADPLVQAALEARIIQSRLFNNGKNLLLADASGLSYMDAKDTAALAATLQIIRDLQLAHRFQPMRDLRTYVLERPGCELALAQITHTWEEWATLVQEWGTKLTEYTRTIRNVQTVDLGDGHTAQSCIMSFEMGTSATCMFYLHLALAVPGIATINPATTGLMYLSHFYTREVITASNLVRRG